MIFKKTEKKDFCSKGNLASQYFTQNKRIFSPSFEHTQSICQWLPSKFVHCFQYGSSDLEYLLLIFIFTNHDFPTKYSPLLWVCGWVLCTYHWMPLNLISNTNDCSHLASQVTHSLLPFYDPKVQSLHAQKTSQDHLFYWKHIYLFWEGFLNNSLYLILNIFKVIKHVCT